MSKKKNKKNRENDYEEQIRIMDEINNVMFNGGKFNFASEEEEKDEDEEYDPLGIFREIEKELDSRFGEEDEEDEDEPESTVEKYESGVKGIRIQYKNDDVKIVEISDGMKTLSIDINALDGDSDEFNYEEEIYNGVPLHDISKVRLVEILTNFYPSAFLTMDMMNEKFWNVSSMNEQSFYFMKSFFDDNIVFGYYISEESLNVYDKIIDDLIIMNKVRSFLTYIHDVSCTHGFAFSNLGESYISQLMILKYMDDATNRFIDMVLTDDDTVIDSSLTRDVEENSFIPIYPFHFKNDAVDSYIAACIDDDEEEDEEEDKDEDADDSDDSGEYSEIQFNVRRNDNEQKETITDEVMNDEPSEEVVSEQPAAEPFSPIDESRAFDSEFEDLFAEEDANDSPGLIDRESWSHTFDEYRDKSPVSENVTDNNSQTEEKKDDVISTNNTDDGEFIVKRRL